MAAAFPWKAAAVLLLLWNRPLMWYYKSEVNRMLRMEIALFVILAFVAYIYFSARRERTPLHRTFSLLLIVVLVHLVLDGATL